MKLRELLSKMQEVQKNIGASEMYLVGGTVRDKLLGNIGNISDLDITNGTKDIDYLSQEFAKELKKTYSITRKTMEDGHSSIFLGNLKIDFSSNFNAPNIEGILNKMGISNPTSLQKEVFSRDFTCNSLLLSLDLTKVLDITKRGLPDIKEKKIRTCLSPEITLTSNRNRVVRAIYLASKLGFDIDQSIIDFVKNKPESIKISSEKSLNEKLNQAFEKDADRASHYLTQMNLWKYVPITESMYPYWKRISSAK